MLPLMDANSDNPLEASIARLRQDEWYEKRNRLSQTLENRGLVGGSLGAMVAFEQLAKMSAKEKRCAECGEPGAVLQLATPYNHVPYWFCDECDHYWKHKND